MPTLDRELKTHGCGIEHRNLGIVTARIDCLERWREIGDAAPCRGREVHAVAGAERCKPEAILALGIGLQRVDGSGSILTDAMQRDPRADGRAHAGGVGVDTYRAANATLD